IVPRLGSLLRPEHTSFPFEARQSRRSRSTSAARSPLSALSEPPAACYTLPRGQKSLGQTRLQLPAVLYPCPHDPGSVGRDPQHVRPEDLPKGLTLEGMETMLSERIDEWNRKLAEKNLKQGRQEERKENLLLLLEEKFGGVDSKIRKRINQAKPDLLREWTVRFVKARTLAEVFGDQPAR